MPYYIRKEGQRKFTVRKRLSGKIVGTTTSREKAQSMIRAIEASEHGYKRRKNGR